MKKLLIIMILLSGVTISYGQNNSPKPVSRVYKMLQNEGMTHADYSAYEPSSEAEIWYKSVKDSSPAYTQSMEEKYEEEAWEILKKTRFDGNDKKVIKGYLYHSYSKNPSEQAYGIYNIKLYVTSKNSAFATLHGSPTLWSTIGRTIVSKNW